MPSSLPRRHRGERYDPGRDYRGYVVADVDRPFLGTGAAADILGVNPETVRNYVRAGKLPGTRGSTSPGSKRSPAVLVPQWAVVGRCELIASHRQADAPREEHYRMRSRALEDALVALRQAEEHARRARELSRQADIAWEAAVATLSDAVAQVLVPQTVERATQ